MYMSQRHQDEPGSVYGTGMAPGRVYGVGIAGWVGEGIPGTQPASCEAEAMTAKRAPEAQ